MNNTDYERFEIRAEQRLNMAEKLGRCAVVTNCLSGMLIAADVGFRNMTASPYSHLEETGTMAAMAVIILSLTARHTTNTYKEYTIRRVVEETDKLNEMES